MRCGKITPHKHEVTCNLKDYKLHFQSPSNSSLSGWEGCCIKINYHFLSFIDKVSCSAGWPGPYYVAKDELELLILLPSSHTHAGITGMCYHTGTCSIGNQTRATSPGPLYLEITFSNSSCFCLCVNLKNVIFRDIN